MKNNICTNCGLEGVITREHVIPKSFFRNLYFFGVSHKEVCRVAGIEYANLIDTMCQSCNIGKGGYLDYSDKRVSRYVSAMLFLIQDKMDSLYKKRRVIMVCKCSECKPVKVENIPFVTFDKVVSKQNAISSIEAHSIPKEIDSSSMTLRESYSAQRNGVIHR